MAKVTFDVIQNEDTIVMIGKAKPLRQAAARVDDRIQSERIEDLRNGDEVSAEHETE